MTLYRFTLTVPDSNAYSFLEIWDHAWDAAADQDGFEQAHGESPWPNYRVLLTDVMTPDDDTLVYHFEVWTKEDVPSATATVK